MRIYGRKVKVWYHSFEALRILQREPARAERNCSSLNKNARFPVPLIPHTEHRPVFDGVDYAYNTLEYTSARMLLEVEVE